VEGVKKNFPQTPQYRGKLVENDQGGERGGGDDHLAEANI